LQQASEPTLRHERKGRALGPSSSPQRNSKACLQGTMPDRIPSAPDQWVSRLRRHRGRRSGGL